MILTQDPDGTRSAQDAPVPTAPNGSARDSHFGRHPEARAANDSATTSSLSGVSCAIDGFCAAAGSENTSEGFVDTQTLASLPSVTAVAPNSGPIAGGTSVTIAGSNFAAGSGVSFGGVPAATTYIDASTLQAVAPASNAAEPVDVTVGARWASGGGPGPRGEAQARETARNRWLNYLGSGRPLVGGARVV